MDNIKYTGQDGVERTRAFLLGHEIKFMSKPTKPQDKPPVSNAEKISHEFDPFLNDAVPF